MSFMAALREWMFRLWGTLTRNSRDREMNEELRSHLEFAAEDMLRRGGSTEDALRQARLRTGGLAQAMDAIRDQRSLPWIDDLARDVRHGLRSFRRSPVFTTVALLTLALAIGANTAMFSVMNSVLFRPLPYRSPEQLVMLWTGTPGQNSQGRPGYRTVEEWRRQSRSFSDIAVLDPVSVTLTDKDGAERISGARISPNFFPVLGIQPLHGRTFSNEEAEQRRRLVLLSHRLWQTRFGGAPEVIGSSIVLDGRASQIIGIMPASSATFGLGADVWEPHTMFPDWETRRAAANIGSWFVVGRLRPNVTPAQAQAEMSSVAGILDSGLPPVDQNRGVTVVPMELQVVGPRPRLCPPDRCGQRDESVAGTQCRAGAGNRHSVHCRRECFTDHPSVACRRRADRRDVGSSRYSAGDCGH
jgi:hypothetical protein